MYIYIKVTVRNKFDNLKISERHTPNDEYENFLLPTWKQQQSAYQPNEDSNVEFHGSYQ